MRNLRNIIVVDYDPMWVEHYATEAKLLHEVFGEVLIEIHHIGSTSIPDMAAKPIIDIMPIVHDITQVDALNPAMIALGYEPRGENGISGRRYFSKGGELHRSHQVHAYEPDNPEVAKHLDFRDYLRSHPDDAQAYADLKRIVARANPHDIEGYMDGKHDFIQGMIKKAQAWRESSK